MFLCCKLNHSLFHIQSNVKNVTQPSLLFQVRVLQRSCILIWWRLTRFLKSFIGRLDSSFLKHILLQTPNGKT